MSVAQQNINDFLNPANPNLDLTSFVFEQINPNRTPKLPFDNFLLAYQQGVPLAPNERFPDDFALGQEEISISRVDSPDKTYVPELKLYVLTRYLPLIRQINTEITDPDYQNQAHGSYHSRPQKCSGPLCRRQKRMKMQESNLLKNHRQAYKTNKTATISKILTNPRAKYLNLRVRSKPYAGPEPLLFLYSAKELTRIERDNLSKYEEHLKYLTRQDLIYPYMLSIFTPDIN